MNKDIKKMILIPYDRYRALVVSEKDKEGVEVPSLSPKSHTPTSHEVDVNTLEGGGVDIKAPPPGTPASSPKVVLDPPFQSEVSGRSKAPLKDSWLQDWVSFEDNGSKQKVKRKKGN